MASEKILVIGANGQIGSVLVSYLSDIYGSDAVVATDIRVPESCPVLFELLDATNAVQMAAVVKKHRISRIFHLAAILSARGEADPLRTWDINTQSYFNVLEVAKEYHVRQVFFPSSIAVFGEHISHLNTGQWAYLAPTTVYGISKAASENWSQYYHKRYGMDIRSLRYPGIISHQSMPGGGTTDYAVDIYHKAVQGLEFECYLGPEIALPMIYMDDAVRATVELMEAPSEQIFVRTSYNLAGMSFNPSEIAASIRKLIPDFKISYKPDFRQDIALSWPQSIDDSQARSDWNWKPQYDLDGMSRVMITELEKRYQNISFV